MKNFNKKIKNKIKEHALQEYPKECCGIIIDKEEQGQALHKCLNLSEDKNNFFKIGVRDYLSATEKGKIIGYYHSHTKEYHDLGFSDFDKKVSDGHGVASLLYSVPNDNFLEHIPTL